MPRQRAAELGQETVNILEAGRYQSPNGTWVDIRDLVRHAVEGTRSYPPDHLLPAVPPGSRQTQIEVVARPPPRDRIGLRGAYPQGPVHCPAPRPCGDCAWGVGLRGLRQRLTRGGAVIRQSPQQLVPGGVLPSRLCHYRLVKRAAVYQPFPGSVRGGSAKVTVTLRATSVGGRVSPDTAHRCRSRPGRGPLSRREGASSAVAP